MRYKFLILLLFYPLFPFNAFTQNKELGQYDVVWTTQSNNASESMPCGGGDIGLDVWVENGEIFLYAARSGSFDENNGLLKAGRVRVTVTPDVFDTKDFKQQLHLQQGCVIISGKKNGMQVSVKIWADVFAPVVHLDIKSSDKISVTAAYESWRYQDRILQPRENFGNSWKWAAPENNVCKKDEISFDKNAVLFYHHNVSTTIFDTTVSQQGLQQVKDSLYNPLAYRCFGGSFKGKNFAAAGIYKGIYVNTDFEGWRLKSKLPAKEQSLQLTLWTSQVKNQSAWKRSLDSLERETATNQASAFKRTQTWWQQFWDRSFIIVNNPDTSSIEWQVGRNFQLFRFMLACNAKGEWPTKFNGGLFTVDPVYTDTTAKLTPDFRNWGGGLHTAQNQRLVYFPMIKNGDWDALQAQFTFYMRILKNAELRTKVYWNHGGACFTEQMENYGLPDFAEYGLNRPKELDKGVEYNPWLEYLWDTSLEFCLMMLEEQRYTGKNISDKIPFIESCLQFFNEHYQYLAKKRGAKIFDENGKLTLYPGSGAETFKMAYNSTSTIAALQIITERLLELPTGYLNENEKKEWEQFLERIPPISYRSFEGHTTIAPAKLWARINNEESPQLYPVYPWGIFGLGKPGIDTAINTWKFDTTVIKFRNYIGWKQDNIFAARLGLTDEAWRLTSLKLKNSPRRFPAFWGPGFDWTPDHNWGGSGMIGLQEMLLQTDGNRILLFPSWPAGKNVHFKLNAPYNTTVEAELKDKKIIMLKVSPEERRKDVEIFIK
ncbi:MAG: DUF5703 domain-containing protein [Bacteroidota bacterium]|nr:DUF5703 domain-containing protein [Bacteroidota bacterium]